MADPDQEHTSRATSWLPRLARVACALYPRDFREQLGEEMCALFGREVRRVASTRGRWAAVWYAATTLAGIALGTLPAHFRTALPPRIQMDALLQDTRFASRTLLENPGFTAVAVLSLALGIGANTAIFSAVNAVLLRGLPYPDAHRLVILYETNPELGIERAGASGPAFLDWVQRADSFTELAAFQPGSATMTDLAEPEQVPGMRVTVNFLSLLGYEPAQGRGFRAEEARGDRHDVAIITDGYWRRAYGADPDILGRQGMADHIAYTLIGVLPETYWFPIRSDLFVPWTEEQLEGMSRHDRQLPVIGRLAPGVALDEAAAEMHAIAGQIGNEHPEAAGWDVLVRRAHEEASATIRPALLVLLGAVGFVLLIACVNVANLTLARGARRQQELAVRAATGASRSRLIRQLLTESMLLAGLGGLLGLLFGELGVRALGTILPAEIPIPGGEGMLLLPEIGVDGTVLAFTAAAAVLAGIVSGIVPAWQVSLVRLTESLKQQERTQVGGTRTRDTLVVAEVALAAVLLVATLLMLQTFQNLGRVDPGFRPDRLLTLQIELPTDSRYRTDRERSAFYRDVLGNMREIRGVHSAGISEILPLDSSQRRVDFIPESGAPTGGAEGIGVDYNIADAGFFDAMRIPLLRGRLFRAYEGNDHPDVALVDATFAHDYFPDQNPVGRQIVAWDQELTIVGVVGAIRSAGLDREPRPTIYRHYLQAPDNMMSFVLRAEGDPAELTAAAKEAVWDVDPEQPVFNIRPMEAVIDAGSSSRRATLLLLGVFGGIALAMAALGVYGVMSYSVGLRVHELGLRKALGAPAANLLRMVVVRGLAIAGAGIAVGIVAAAILGRALSSLLYGVTTSQPSALVGVALLLFAVAAVATFVPARRASRVDPGVALRGQ